MIIIELHLEFLASIMNSCHPNIPWDIDISDATLLIASILDLAL